MSHDKLTNNQTVLIVNPNSGGGATGKNWESLYNQIKKILGENPEVVFSQTSGDITILTRDFLRKGFRKIIALGGDGTINEVANGFFEQIPSENNDDQAIPVLKPINAEAVRATDPVSNQTIPQEATKLKKLGKVSARYMEIEQFSDSDHHTGYFCYNCVYFMKPHHCVIVTDEGEDVNGRTSGVIISTTRNMCPLGAK